jgi:uncharacterized surface protein with fasciclin (FAS1) repeats
MHRRATPALALAGLLVFAGCTDLPTQQTSAFSDQAVAERPAQASAGAANAAPAPSDQTIADIAIGAGFTELVGALAYVDGELGTNLIELVADGTDQYTVFAPTNAAFQELYGLLSVVLGGPVGGITDLPAEIVLDVLLYHVVEGRRAANSVVPARGERTMTPVLGETFGVRTDATIRDGLTGVRQTDAAIQAAAGLANLSASNGIVHVIDQVIVPPSVVAAITGG